jgi:hypothetical protein
MAQEFRKILVPKEIESEVDIFVHEIQKSAAETGEFKKDDIELIKPEFVQLGGAELLDAAVVYVATPVIGWVTKAWFDAYVLPVFMKRAKKPSQEFMHWLENTFKKS